MIIKVKETDLPENIHKCSVCCCNPEKVCCAEFEEEHGFDDCNNGHYYMEEK